MEKPATPISLTPEQQARLEGWTRAATTPQRLARRARIILLAAAGQNNAEIARSMGVSREQVILWRKRFAALGPEGLTQDAPRPGPTSTRVPPEKVRAVVEATLHTKPPQATHWSLRTMAAAQHLAPSTIQKIWKAHHLQPHRAETFKLSLDPQFVEKLTDVIALYVDPPEKALVFCVDEKSQIQALDRTQPLLPLREGLPERQTHDYKRNGTTTLFTAFNTLDGRVTGACYQKHRHEEFLAFLALLDRQTPTEVSLHLILDNYGTHKHPNVRTWCAAHPRFHFHFTPTSCSWANLVERWFAAITSQRIRRGTFRSVAELETAIYDYIEHYNTAPTPYLWTASLEKIVRKINRVYGDS
jgi:transposase